MDLTLANPTDTPSDWSRATAELHCPLCEYNLRGLIEPRCPECGFAFRWSELVDARRTKHPYLFEHQTKRNIWSFWKTYWHDCRPRRFWSDLNPAQAVSLLRMLIYAVLSSCVPLLVLLIPQPHDDVFSLWREVMTDLQLYGYGIKPVLGPLWGAKFLKWEFSARVWDCNAVGPCCMPFVWAILTFASLMIFRVSMRQAKVSTLHVLRCVVYGCDFGFLVLVASIFSSRHDWYSHADWTLATIALLCAAVGTYRIGFAYSRYLRFPRPWATVIASQGIVFLLVFIACVWCEIWS